MQPLISIICPTFNSGRVLETLIQSVLSQDYPRVELLIIDGGSTDPVTLDILARYNDRARVVSGRDKGIYDAMNKGVELSKGDWLYFIGSDDKLHDPHVLSEVFGRDDLADKDLIVGSCYFGKTLRRYSLTWKMYLENTVLHQAAFYARHVFDRYRYESTFKVYSDYDLNFFCYREYNRALHVPTVFTDYSLDGVSSQVSYVSYSEELKVRKKYIHSLPLRALLSLYTYARYAARKTLSTLHLPHIA